MSEQTWRALVGQVRWLADELAPRAPEAAIAAFDVLVATHGRSLAAHALYTVAGDDLTLATSTPVAPATD